MQHPHCSSCPLQPFIPLVLCLLLPSLLCPAPSPSCTTTMTESPAHRLGLHICGKYRFSKKIDSSSFGMCCSNLTPFAFAHPPHLPALQPWQKIPLTDSISMSVASIGSARRLTSVLSVRAVLISHRLHSLTPLTFLHYNHVRKSHSQTRSPCWWQV